MKYFIIDLCKYVIERLKKCTTKKFNYRHLASYVKQFFHLNPSVVSRLSLYPSMLPSSSENDDVGGALKRFFFSNQGQKDAII